MDEFLKMMENRRTIRKFRQDPVPADQLRRIVRLGSLAPSGSNLQPLKFMTVTGARMCARLFKHTTWAGYLLDGAPKEGERPPAYLLLLGDMEIKKNCDIDAGIALGTMAVAAEAMGLSTCLLGAIDREGIRSLLGISVQYEIHTLVAVGKPAMTASICEIEDDDVKYFYRGEEFFVPKRTLKEVLIREIKD